MKPILVAVNPASGGGRTRRRWPELERALRSVGADVEAVFTTGPLDATRIARRGIEEGRELVVAAGGDGTISETAAGFLDGGAALATSTRFGVLPTGTGGDFRRTFDLPVDPAAAARAWLAGQPLRIDAGRVTMQGHDGGTAVRHFVNIADAGIGGEVVDRVNRWPKLLPGGAQFMLASVVSLLRWRNTPVHIDADGEILELRAQQVVVANCRYFGGGMQMAPMADPCDGRLDLVVVGDVGAVENVRGLSKIRAGTHLEEANPKLSVRRVQRVEVTSEARVRVDVDGEQPGFAPAVFDVIPSAITLMTPAP